MRNSSILAICHWHRTCPSMRNKVILLLAILHLVLVAVSLEVSVRCFSQSSSHSLHIQRESSMEEVKLLWVTDWISGESLYPLLPREDLGTLECGAGICCIMETALKPTEVSTIQCKDCLRPFHTVCLGDKCATDRPVDWDCGCHYTLSNINM